MAKIKRIMPFGIWPANWGLTGKRREEAEAEYHYTGEDLERRLIEIREKPNSKEFKLANLQLDYDYGKLEEEEYDRAVLAVEYPDVETAEYMLAELEIDQKHGYITNNDKERISASLRGEPWFKIIGGEHQPNGDHVQMAFELDWNEEFVRELEEQGWKGPSDDAIVNAWFEEACRQMLVMEPLDDDEEAPLNPFQRTRKRTNESGKSEYF